MEAPKLLKILLLRCKKICGEKDLAYEQVCLNEDKVEKFL